MSSEDQSIKHSCICCQEELAMDDKLHCEDCYEEMLAMQVVLSGEIRQYEDEFGIEFARADLTRDTIPTKE
jgi:hypothetical protein